MLISAAVSLRPLIHFLKALYGMVINEFKHWLGKNNMALLSMIFAGSVVVHALRLVALAAIILLGTRNGRLDMVIVAFAPSNIPFLL